MIGAAHLIAVPTEFRQGFKALSNFRRSGDVAMYV
jgi:hypothetical protein